MEFEKGQKAYESKSYASALTHYENVVHRYEKTPLAIEAAQEAARIAYYDLKDYRRAIKNYEHIILYSPNQQDRIEAQRKIAEINFSNLQDYAQAIVEYHKLLDLPHNTTQGLEYQLAVARSYYYQNNFFQALVETDGLLDKFAGAKGLFDAFELKANILMQTKKLDDAVVVLRQILEKYPAESKERQTGLLLTVVYEEKKDFAKAIETLESIKDSYPNPAFIEARIKNLKERQSYLPGAKGWRK